MFDPATFQHRDGAFVSRTIDSYALSPVYLIAVAARRAIEASGWTITLHDDYGPAAFEQLAWLTGAYGKDVRITPRQAGELVEIGARLLGEFRGELAPREIEAIEWLTCFVESALANDDGRRP